MQLSQETDCAVRIMLEIASRPAGEPVTTLQIARRRLAPRPFVRKIVSRLVAAGLLHSRRGARGGLLLARPGEAIDLRTVVEAVQGPIAVNRCVLQPDFCPLQPICPFHEVCRVARSQFVALLQGVSLADLARRGAELRRRPGGELGASASGGSETATHSAAGGGREPETSMVNSLGGR